MRKLGDKTQSGPKFVKTYNDIENKPKERKKMFLQLLPQRKLEKKIKQT